MNYKQPEPPLFYAVRAFFRLFAVSKVLNTSKAKNAITDVTREDLIRHAEVSADKKARAFKKDFFDEIEKFLKQEREFDKTYMERQDPCQYCKKLQMASDENEESFDTMCELGCDPDEDRSKCGCPFYDPYDDAKEQQQQEIQRRKDFWKKFDEKEFKSFFLKEILKYLEQKTEERT